MNRRGRFLIVIPLLSMFTVVSLSALAQEPRRPHGEPRASAIRHEYRRFDPRHFDHRTRRPLGSNAGDVLSLDSTPIFFTDPKWAKELAKACHPCPRKEAKGLCWVLSAAEERGSQ
jgi:hypothetical protein